ncbi:Murein polymerase [Providencia alcalifaciens]|nr:Murein polymerase [Providencia alcalifaciens]
MRVMMDGQFSCSDFGGGRMLPVWTDDPQSLCQGSTSQDPAWNLNGNNEAPQEEAAPDWVKDMFGDSPSNSPSSRTP